MRNNKFLLCLAIAAGAVFTVNAEFRSVYVNGGFEKNNKDKKTNKLRPKTWEVSFSANGRCDVVEEAMHGSYALALHEATVCSSKVYPTKKDTEVVVSFAIKGKANSLMVLLTGFDSRKNYLSMLRQSLTNVDTKGKWKQMKMTFDLAAMSDEYGRGIAYIGKLTFGGKGTDFLLDDVEIKVNIPDGKIYDIEMTDTPKDKKYVRKN